MAHRYEISGVTTDGSYLSDVMPVEYKEAWFDIRFFSDAAMTAQVTPSAGTVTITGSPDGANYFNLASGGVIAATDVYLASRDFATAAGPLQYAKVTLAGITGAAYFKCTVTRY